MQRARTNGRSSARRLLSNRDSAHNKKAQEGDRQSITKVRKKETSLDPPSGQSKKIASSVGTDRITNSSSKEEGTLEIRRTVGGWGVNATN